MSQKDELQAARQYSAELYQQNQQLKQLIDEAIGLIDTDAVPRREWMEWQERVQQILQQEVK